MTAQVLYRGAIKDVANSAAIGLDFDYGRRTGLFLKDHERQETRQVAGGWFIKDRARDVWPVMALAHDRDTIIQTDFGSLSPWKRVERAIEEWRSLSDDWDFEGGIAPRKSALTALLGLVRRALEEKVPAGRAYVASDGEIGLKWDATERIATASFLNDGRFLAYCPTPSGNPVRVIGDYASAASAKDFFQAVRALT